MSKKVTPAPKSLDDLATLAADQANEIEIDAPGDDDVLVFEGGEWDGKKMPASRSRSADTETDEETPAAATPAETLADATTPEGEATIPPAQVTPAEAAPEGQEAAAVETTTEPATPAAVTPAYQPNLTYQVYKEQKEFPEWVKPLITSKEVEENVRTSLQKSEAFDALKPRHETVVQERDEARSIAQEQQANVDRMIALRDQNLALFLKKMGVSDKALVDYAARLAVAEKDPDAHRDLIRQRDDDARAYDQAQENQRNAARQAADFERVHRTNCELVLSQPDVQQFRSRMDAAYGAGTFERVLTDTGSLAYQRGEGYLHPMEAVRRVTAHYGAALQQPVPPVAQLAPAQAQPAPAPAVTQPRTQAAPAAPQHGAAPARSQTRTPPATIPNVGRGGTVSPTRSKMRSLADVEKRVKEELGR